MEDSTRRPSGPETYAALFEQSPDVVMGNPLIYAILCDALHQGIERFYESREEVFRQAKDAEAEGKISFIKPELMKSTIEDCHDLLSIAKSVADGKYPEEKASVVTVRDSSYAWRDEEQVRIDFRNLLRIRQDSDLPPSNGKIQIEQH